jgi:hypothetical protein
MFQGARVPQGQIFTHLQRFSQKPFDGTVPFIHPNGSVYPFSGKVNFTPARSSNHI